MNNELTIKKPQVGRNEAAELEKYYVEDIQYIELSPTVNRKPVLVFDKERAKELATKTVIALKPFVETFGVVVIGGAYFIVGTFKLCVDVLFGLLRLFVECFQPKSVPFVDDNYNGCPCPPNRNQVNVETNVNVSGENVKVNVQTNINIK